MLIHFEGKDYLVEYEAKDSNDMNVWLVDEATGQEEDLYHFPDAIQDKAWDLAFEDFLENGVEGVDSSYYDDEDQQSETD